MIESQDVRRYGGDISERFKLYRKERLLQIYDELSADLENLCENSYAAESLDACVHELKTRFGIIKDSAETLTIDHLVENKF